MTAMEQLHDALALARRHGADAGDAMLGEYRSTEITCRAGKVERTGGSEGLSVSLRVFLGKRSATVSAAGVGPEALRELVEQAIVVARHSPEDPYAGLVSREYLASGDDDDLALYDDAQLDAEMLRQTALEMEDAALAVPGVTRSSGATAGFSSGRRVVCSTNGLAAQTRSTSFSRSCQVLAIRDDEMIQGGDWTSQTWLEDLRGAADLGRGAAKKAVASLGRQRMKTGKFPIVFDPDVAGVILRSLLGAISGPAVAMGTTFLKDAMGEQVFGEHVSIIEDPLRVRGHRSRHRDGEGVRSLRRAIIDDGMLTTWLLNRASATQLGLGLTGHGGTLGGGVVTSNTYIDAGQHSRDELMSDIGYGLYVTNLIGGGGSQLTGDYSQGAGGFLIENGRLTTPVKEATIAGNLKEMFRSMVPANDLVFRSGTDAPTLRIDGMTVGGD